MRSITHPVVRPIVVGRTLCVAVAALWLGCQPTGEHDTAPGSSAEAPAASSQTTSTLHFTQIATSSGLQHRHTSGTAEQKYIIESISGGVALLDVDGDGRLDLFFVDATRADGAPDGAGHRLYLNETTLPDGPVTYRDVSSTAGITHDGWGMGAAVGDIDNDGDPDLYITYWGADRLWRNDSADGQIRFTDITQAAGLGQTGWGTSAAFADVDGDGLLDLYVTNYLEFDLQNPPADGNWCRFKEVDSYCGPEGVPAQADHLYRNLGDGRFADISQSSGIDRWSYPGLGVLFVDIEWDGDLDIYVANDSEPNLLFRNDTDATGVHFAEIGTRLGVAYSDGGLAQAGMGLDGGDVDNDGDIDIYVTNFSDDVNTLYANDGQGWFADATYATGMGGVVRPFLGWSAAFDDLDNDGWLDLFVANGHVYPALQSFPSGLAYAQRNLLYRNDAGRFAETGEAAGLDRISASRGAAIGDIDNDGDADIVVANLNDTPSLWRNDGGNRATWIGLDLVGTASNRDAIGARVRLYAGDQIQTRQVQRGRGFESQFDPRVRFGLGQLSAASGAPATADSIVIDWPSGTRQTLHQPATRRYWLVTEDGEPVAGIAVPAPTDRSIALAAEVAGDFAAGNLAAGDVPAADLGAGDAASDLGGDAAVLRQQAASYYEQGRYGESRACLERAIELDPQDVRSTINLAMVHFSGFGDFEASGKTLDQALEIDPQRREAHHLLGKVRLRQSRLDEAIQSLAEAARLAPTSGEYQGWLGLAYQRQGDHRAAEAAFRASARLAPWDPRPYLNLGRLYETSGLRDSTIAARAFATFEQLAPAQRRVDHYKRKLAEYPDHAAAPYLLGRAYEDQDRGQLAERNYRQALKLEPGYAPALHGLGRLLQARGQLPEAIAAYEQARQQDPDLVGIDNDLGQAYHFTRRFDEAVSAYERGLGKNTDPAFLPILHTNVAMAQAMRGQLEAAQKAFETSLKLDPDQVDTRDALAQVLLARGLRKEAVAQWQEVLRRQPGHAGARQRLQQLQTSY